jgi:glycosyltransferase involved in cell wall biosynthesis
MYNSLRVLVIAEAANPEWTSVPLVGWSHFRALSEIVDVHLVTQVRNRPALIAAGLREDIDFTAIDSEMVAAPLYKLATFLRGGTDRAWTIDTAIASFSYYYFEQIIWKRFFKGNGKENYDIVHRITPLSPTTPSILAKRLRSIGIPFLVGPLNGGVPWSKEFSSTRRQEGEWLSSFRSISKLMPAYRGTQKYASVIIVGSINTWYQYSTKYKEKLIYIPENGVDTKRFCMIRERQNNILKAAFVGRLVPYKGCEIVLKSIAPFIMRGDITLDIFGDGPQRKELEDQAKAEGISMGVRFHGFVKNSEIQDLLVLSDLLLFPSIREFGGGVVLEAMALGVVPVVVDYGGPSEFVNSSCGYLLRLDSKEKIVEQLSGVIAAIIKDSSALEKKRANCRERVRKLFTWEAKAKQTKKIYEWVIGNSSEKPDFGMPLQ